MRGKHWAWRIRIRFPKNLEPDIVDPNGSRPSKQHAVKDGRSGFGDTDGDMNLRPFSGATHTGARGADVLECDDAPGSVLSPYPESRDPQHVSGFDVGRKPNSLAGKNLACHSLCECSKSRYRFGYRLQQTAR